MWMIGWVVVCLFGPATCSDYIHWAAGIPTCEEAKIGDICYRPGQPMEVKTKTIGVN